MRTNRSRLAGFYDLSGTDVQTLRQMPVDKLLMCTHHRADLKRMGLENAGHVLDCLHDATLFNRLQARNPDCKPHMLRPTVVSASRALKKEIIDMIEYQALLERMGTTRVEIENA